jgi:hypothetical protein
MCDALATPLYSAMEAAAPIARRRCQPCSRRGSGGESDDFFPATSHTPNYGRVSAELMKTWLIKRFGLS